MASHHLVHEILTLILELKLLVHVCLCREMRYAHTHGVHSKVRSSNLLVVLSYVLLNYMERFKFEGLSILRLDPCYLLDVIVLNILISDLLEDFSW